METNNVKIGETEYTIKKLSYGDGLSLGDEKTSKDRILKLLSLTVTPIPDVNKISMEEGLKLTKEVNDFIGLSPDFLRELGISPEALSGGQNI